MAALKWIFVVVFGLGSAGALGMAFVNGGVSRPITPRTAPPISLRQFPVMVASAATPKAPDLAKDQVAKDPEPEAVKPEPVAAKPQPVVVAKPAPVAKPPEPKPEPKAEPVVKAEPAPRPEPVAAKPAAADGLINLRATDTADVYLDGKKLGGSPLLGVKAKIGNHKVRFDCYDAAGNTIAGPVQTIAVKGDGEVDVEYPCPVE